MKSMGLYRDYSAPERKRLRVEARKAVTASSDYLVMEDDFHLIDLALEADNAILSRDETARRVFEIAAPLVLLLRKIIWVNPCLPADTVIEWIRTGAKAEQRKKLC
jgi:hypothetical protein